MSTGTRIEWCDATWNPTSGCSKVSPACDHCYAERMAHRLAGRAGYGAIEPFTVTLHPDKLDEPLRWRQPKRVFVVSMGDLFHPLVPEDYIRQVCETISACSHHTFMLLTKRPDRLREIVGHRWWWRTPPQNVWLGVTAEDQQRADERIPILLDTPAAVRFVSCEPLLGPLDLSDYLAVETLQMPWGQHATERTGEVSRLDWVIVGCESGPERRGMLLNWARVLRDQCVTAGVSFYLKQAVTNGVVTPHPQLDGREWMEIPDIGERKV